jgi:hypothetical protein
MEVQEEEVYLNILFNSDLEQVTFLLILTHLVSLTNFKFIIMVHLLLIQVLEVILLIMHN